MTSPPRRTGFAARPVDAERWVKTADARPGAPSAELFTARLTVDITPDLRGRIKVAAFQRGLTVAEMLRDLFAREFPPPSGEGS
jgi:hypothetical protein